MSADTVRHSSTHIILYVFQFLPNKLYMYIVWSNPLRIEFWRVTTCISLNNLTKTEADLRMERLTDGNNAPARKIVGLKINENRDRDYHICMHLQTGKNKKSFSIHFCLESNAVHQQETHRPLRKFLGIPLNLYITQSTVWNKCGITGVENG